MEESSIPLTAFRVPWGLYEFTRLPQGLVNSPGTFMRIMEYLFGDLNISKLLLYLDDILVFSSSQSEHMERLDEVFSRLIAAGLKLNGKKCSFLQTETLYLGHVVNQHGISMDPSKVEKIKSWPIPQTSEQLASFIGLASYYRRFIKGFAAIAAPLHALKPSYTRRGEGTTSFDWTPEADSAFLRLKEALVQAPVLAYPRFNQDFILEIDASLKGLGACLSQIDENGEVHPLAYASRGLRGSELKYRDYSSFKLELLGLNWAVTEKFGDLLMGHHCEVLTDNNPLAHLETAKLGATEQRWVAKLALYDISTKYRTGKSNKVADALSRHPLNNPEFVVGTFSLVNSTTDTSPLLINVNNADLKLPESGTRDNQASCALPSYTRDQLVTLQENDPFISKIWSRKVSGWQPGQVEPDRDIPGLYGWLREYDRYHFHKGLLYHLKPNAVTPDVPVYRLLIPEQLQPVLLEAAHDKWGHQGVARTSALLQARCYWPGMVEQTKAYIRKCAHCTVAKAPLPKLRAPMKHLLAFKPLELLAIDFVKLDHGKGGVEDVLVMTDAFTKWAQAIPCADQSAITVARKLIDHWFSIYGVPTRIHSDQGRCFEGAVIHQLCHLYNIKKSKTSVYHPQGNGQTERFNRTLIGLIKSLESSDRRKWPQMLPHLVFIYNSTQHSVTGFSPYALMFGREPQIPLDHLLGRVDAEWSEDFVAAQSGFITKAWQLTRDRLESNANKEKRRYDRKVHLLPLKIGSRVLLQRTGFRDRHKLEDNFSSTPYIIVALNDKSNLCEIRPAMGGPSRWINRKMLVIDPREASVTLEPPNELLSDSVLGLDDLEDSVSGSGESSDQDEPEFQFVYEPNPPDRADVEDVINQPEETFLRRSQRATKGQHSNPFREPHPV